MEVFKNFLVAGIFTCLLAFNLNVANAFFNIVHPANGLYSLQPQCAPNKELTVENAGTKNGANVFIWSINSNWHTQPSHQKWWIERIGNSDWYTIKAENSGLALNVDAGIGRDGTNITLWQKLDDNQTFRFFDGGNGYYIIQGHTHGSDVYVLDVAAARNQDGTNVHVWHYNKGAPEQKWKLVRRNPSSQPQPQNNSGGLLSPIKPNITVTSVSSSTNGFKCDYVTNGEIPVYAPAKGRVSFRQSYAKRYNKLASYGNNIRFFSADGQYEIRLCHLSRFVGCREPLRFTQTLAFPCGQTNSNYGPFDTLPIDTIDVNQGDLIGYTGMTGNAKGHHIHIEVYKNGKAVNPKSVFKPW